MFAEESKVPSVLGLISDHLVDLVDLVIDEFGHLRQEFLDNFINGVLEPSSNLVQEGVG